MLFNHSLALWSYSLRNLYLFQPSQAKAMPSAATSFATQLPCHGRNFNEACAGCCGQTTFSWPTIFQPTWFHPCLYVSSTPQLWQCLTGQDIPVDRHLIYIIRGTRAVILSANIPSSTSSLCRFPFPPTRSHECSDSVITFRTYSTLFILFLALN